MQPKKHIPSLIIVFFLTYSHCINFVFAGFQLGDSSLPIDEEEFIEYDFEDNLPPEPYKLKVEFVKLYQYEAIIPALGANISLSNYKSNSSSYEVLNFDSIEYQNKLCLLYNKTVQLFRYGDHMNNLLIHGYGGYYIIPDNPVDVNIVKTYIENYTAWFAYVSENTVTIDIANDEVILTYNDKGILIKEEIKSNNELKSTLTLIESKNNLDNIVFIVSIIAIIAMAAFLIPIIIRTIKRR